MRKSILIAALWFLLCCSPVAALPETSCANCDHCLEEVVVSFIDRGWLGLSLLPEDRGLTVVKVDPEGPAASTAIRPGDLLLAVGEESTEALASEAFQRVLARIEPGATVDLLIERDGVERMISIRTVPMPSEVMIRALGAYVFGRHAPERPAEFFVAPSARSQTRTEP